MAQSFGPVHFKISRRSRQLVSETALTTVPPGFVTCDSYLVNFESTISSAVYTCPYSDDIGRSSLNLCVRSSATPPLSLSARYLERRSSSSTCR